MCRPKAFVALFAVLTVAAVPPSVASAWAPVGQATVHPGVQVFTEGVQSLHAHTHSGFDEMKLVPGTEPFKANLVGAILGF